MAGGVEQHRRVEFLKRYSCALKRAFGCELIKRGGSLPCVIQPEIAETHLVDRAVTYQMNIGNGKRAGAVITLKGERRC